MIIGHHDEGHACVDTKIPLQSINDARLKGCNIDYSIRKDKSRIGADRASSCFYCWRNLSDGAKKPTYAELFAFENSRQSVIGSTETTCSHSTLITSPSSTNSHGMPM